MEAEDRGVRKWLRSMRVRIVGLLVLLLLVSSLGSLLLLRAALFTSLERDVEASLSREVEEFQRLSGGSDPRTGQPFAGDVEAIFDITSTGRSPTRVRP